jgi:hypothetical protein
LVIKLTRIHGVDCELVVIAIWCRTSHPTPPCVLPAQHAFKEEIGEPQQGDDKDSP